MSRASKGIGFIVGSLAVFGLGCSAGEPRPIPEEAHPLKDVSFTSKGDVTEVGSSNPDKLFVVGVGGPPSTFFRVPTLPATKPIPNGDLREGWGVIEILDQSRFRPCGEIADCTPLDEPPDLVQQFGFLLDREINRCRRCEQILDRCQNTTDMFLASECEFCKKYCPSRKNADDGRSGSSLPLRTSSPSARPTLRWIPLSHSSKASWRGLEQPGQYDESGSAGWASL